MLTGFNFNKEKTTENFAVVLQDKIDRVVVNGLQTYYQMPKDVLLRSSGRYASMVDTYTPVRAQLLLELIGDNFKIRGEMISNHLVEVLRIMGPKETVPHD